MKPINLVRPMIVPPVEVWIQAPAGVEPARLDLKLRRGLDHGQIASDGPGVTWRIWHAFSPTALMLPLPFGAAVMARVVLEAARGPAIFHVPFGQETFAIGEPGHPDSYKVIVEFGPDPFNPGRMVAFPERVFNYENN